MIIFSIIQSLRNLNLFPSYIDIIDTQRENLLYIII